MRRLLLVALPIVMTLLVLPSAASAAVCADYSNQAAAQAAADTVDADGDGIYCESLPCPCSTGSSSPAPPPVVTPPPPPPPEAGSPQPILPCTPTSRPVAAFRGLSTRAAYGVQDRFSVSVVEPSGDARAIRVKMMDEATTRVFFAGPVEPDELLFHQLDLDDGPSVIAADYLEERGETLCLRHLQRRITGYRRMLLPARCRAGSYRPKSVALSCGSGGYDLERLQWRGWNNNIATARGRARINDCIPFCAEGTARRYPVHVRASRPRFCPGDSGLRYTRLQITYPRNRLNGVPRRSTRSFACRTSLDTPSP